MKLSRNTQEAINLIGEFRLLTDRLFALGCSLNFPKKDSNGLEELNNVVTNLEALLHRYAAAGLDSDADEMIAEQYEK